MILIDLDQLDMPGYTTIKKILDKWEKEHPIKEIVVRDDGEWMITIVRKRKGK